MTADLEALSEREKETLRLLLEGHDAKSVARSLGLSVHTANERLRASRRKLGVSTSREAARLLARSEQRPTNSFVDKQIGVAGDGVDADKGRRLIGRKGVQHPIALAIGGTLVMSLIIATAVLTLVASESIQPGPSANWSVARAVPERVPQAMNNLRLDGNRLLWNGQQVSEAVVREFLGLLNQMTPQPLMILSYSAQTPPERIQRARLLIEDVIRCRPSDCLEITISPA
jgi:DNA-binding CsgD family transcriptional regulator